MADAVTATTVVDGARTAVIYCTNTSDGTGESAVTKVDVSGLSSLQNGTACTGVRLEKIVFSIQCRHLSLKVKCYSNHFHLKLCELFEDGLFFQKPH